MRGVEQNFRETSFLAAHSFFKRWRKKSCNTHVFPLLERNLSCPTFFVLNWRVVLPTSSGYRTFQCLGVLGSRSAVYLDTCLHRIMVTQWEYNNSLKVFWEIKLDFTGRAWGLPPLSWREEHWSRCGVFAVPLQGWRWHRRRWDGEQGSTLAAGAAGLVLCCSCPAPNKFSPHSSVNTRVQCGK